MPSSSLTDTSTCPAVVVDGAFKMIWVGEMLVKLVIGVLPKSTVVGFVVCRSVPVMMTPVKPPKGPTSGAMLVMLGVGVKRLSNDSTCRDTFFFLDLPLRNIFANLSKNDSMNTSLHTSPVLLQIVGNYRTAR